MTLDLKKFDMRDISFRCDEAQGPVVVLIGRRDTGKSFLVRDLQPGQILSLTDLSWK